MDYAALRTLIETHPSHAATSDSDMLTWLDDDTAVAYLRETMPANEIMDIVLTNLAEWTAISADEKQIVDMIMSHNDPVPVLTGTNTRTTLAAVLGANTQTALGVAQAATKSRAVDAGFNRQLSTDHIAHARTF